MTSTRLTFFILVIIFLIIVVLASSRIATGLRSRLGRFLPSFTANTGVKATPTPEVVAKGITPTPTSSIVTKKNTQVSETPATGANTIVLFSLGGSLLAGITLRRIKI